MHPPLHGQAALVTGASRGIGRAIAERLAADGAVVAVHYASDAEAARVTIDAIEATGGAAFGVRARFGGSDTDLPALFEEVDAGVAKRLGTARLDVLVNNAGVVAVGAIEDVSLDQFERVFAVNVRDPFFVTKLALERMDRGARIVTISSGVTQIAHPEGTAYGMTKAAIEQLVKALAKHLGPRGISVNAVAPGIIDTDMNSSLHDDTGAWERAASLSALGGVGRPDDVANTVAFLSSRASRWITGRTIVVDGGTTLG